MKIFILILITFYLSSCKINSNIEGLWYPSYEENIYGIVTKNIKSLFYLKGQKLYIIEGNTLASGLLIIDSTTAKIGKRYIKFDGEKVKYQCFTDSLVLMVGDTLNQKIILKKIPKQKNSIKVNRDLSGSYTMHNQVYNDSLEFINDSTLIFTGDNYTNNSAFKWEVIEYDGIKIFNIKNPLFPLMVIESWSKEKIELSNPGPERSFLILEKLDTQFYPELLLGSWVEDTTISNSIPPPPPLPPYQGMPEYDLLYRLYFDTDSVRISHYGRTRVRKWSFTNDGKRIYFINKLFKNNGSWKIVKLTKDSLFLKWNSWPRDTELTIRFKKDAVVNI